MNDTEQRVLHGLGDTPGASLWESLLALFRVDPEALFLLACDGVGAESAARLVELAELARRIRVAVRGSYEIQVNGGRPYLTGPRVEPTFIPANLVDQARAFLLAVDGKGVQERPGKDYEGTAGSEAEARFWLGERETWEADRTALNTILDAEPLVLQLDTQDVAHLGWQPRYVTYGLKVCARRVVLAPTHVFRGLNRGEGCQDNLTEGYAFCGKPRRAVDNLGRPIPVPDDMVYVVYADIEGYVFDWDWVLESDQERGSPTGREGRFGVPVQLKRDAVLELPEQLPEPRFDWKQACYSPRGDCIFCYIRDDVSYACRINSDLTVFRSLQDRQTITGFKIKNVRRILEEDKDIFLDDDPDLIVELESVLLATLKGHRDAQISVYQVIIRAIGTAPEPPKVRVPKRRAGRSLEYV